jgi:hypothetical protein
MLLRGAISVSSRTVAGMLLLLSSMVSAQSPAKDGRVGSQIEEQFGSRLKENPGGNVVQRVGSRINTRINSRIDRADRKGLDAIYTNAQKIYTTKSTVKRPDEIAGEQ